MSTLRKFIREDEGADLIEYALLAGIIAVGCMAALSSVAGSLSGVFTRVNTAVAALIP